MQIFSSETFQHGTLAYRITCPSSIHRLSNGAAHDRLFRFQCPFDDFLSESLTALKIFTLLVSIQILYIVFLPCTCRSLET